MEPRSRPNRQLDLSVVDAIIDDLSHHTGSYLTHFGDPQEQQRAEAALPQLLALQPEHPQGSYCFYIFLTSTARGQAAVPYLEKAMAKGVDEPAYTLGLAYLTLSDKRKALLRDEYAAMHPKDVASKQLAQAIQMDTGQR